MLERQDIPHWKSLLRPLADASIALGRFGHALETTPLHTAFLWREIVHVSTRISQYSGYRVQRQRLVQHLAGVPLSADEGDAGLAAARRIFLTAAPLFRTGCQLDSKSNHQELFAPLWGDADPTVETETIGDHQNKKPLTALVRMMTDSAGSGVRPTLVDLFLALRRLQPSPDLPASLARLALPLALHRSGLMPKAAPGLLGGRVPLSPDGNTPITAWLARGLASLAREADAANRRLADLSRQHRGWMDGLASAGLRGHARAPMVIDLLAVTPVLSATLVARHLGCTPQGAGAILRRMVTLGILVEAVPRSRWKIYLARDLSGVIRAETNQNPPLPFSTMPAIDVDAITATLDSLCADLDRLNQRVCLLGNQKNR